MTPLKLQRWAGVAAVVNLALLFLLSGHPSFSNASRPVRGISNPILAMEMVRNVAEVDTILGDTPGPDREVMRLKQYVDFAFIAAYSSLFVLMSLVLINQGRVIAIVAAALGILAAIFDVVENIGILRVLDFDLHHTTQAMIDAIRYPSLIKWGCASFALLLLGILACRSARRGLQIIGALDVAAGLVGAGGLLDNRLLLWQGPMMLGGFIGLAILFFRPYWPGHRRT